MPDQATRSSRTAAYPPRPEPTASFEDRQYPPPLSEERKAALLAYWRDVLTGAAEPEVLKIPPEVEARVRWEFPEPMSPAVWKDACEEYALRKLYGGEWVFYIDTPRGLAVIAIGRDEAILLVQSFPLAHRRGVETTYPPPWDEV